MGGGYKTPLKPIRLRQKKAVRLIACVHYLATTPNLFYDLNILTVFDLYKCQLAVFNYLCITTRVVNCHSYLMTTFLLMSLFMITVHDFGLG